MTPTVPDVQADSSPAIEVPRDGAAYAEWRQTGKLPDASASKPKTEKSATSTESSAEGDQPKGTATASEAGTKNNQEKKQRDNAASRLTEILDDLKRAGLTPAELKAFKREAQKAETAAPAEKPASEQTAKPDDLKPPVKPDPTKLKSYEELEAAKEKYFEDLTDYKVQLAIQKDRLDRAADAARETTFSKIREAETRYGAESGGTIAATAREISGDQQIAPAVKELIGGSDIMADLLYTIGKGDEKAVFLQLARTDPGGAIRKVVVMEGLIRAELAKGKGTQSESADTTERGEDGKFVSSKKAPEKKESSAPPPAHEVSGRGTTPPDPVDRAVKDNDFRAFRNAENSKAMKGRYRS